VSVFFQSERGRERTRLERKKKNKDSENRRMILPVVLFEEKHERVGTGIDHDSQIAHCRRIEDVYLYLDNDKETRKKRN
jgi:hypothetical protein